MAKKTKKTAPVEVVEADKEVVRVTFRLHGPELVQVREVKEMLSLNSELDAARYIMQRGLEAMAATLSSRRSTTKMAAVMDPEKLFEQMFAKMGITPEMAAKLG
jgi:uncharacterized protein YutE (UPF0331/DUF86 family)